MNKSAEEILIEKAKAAFGATTVVYEKVCDKLGWTETRQKQSENRRHGRNKDSEKRENNKGNSWGDPSSPEESSGRPMADSKPMARRGLMEEKSR